MPNFAWSLVILVLTSLVGARISVGVRAGEISFLWLYVVAVCSMTAWVVMMRSNVKMSFATILFDVVAAGVYLVAFVWMGEKITPIQIMGAVLALIGVALMS